MSADIDQSAMIQSGPGVYFDGVSGERREVSVELEKTYLAIRAEEGHLLERWRYADIDHLWGQQGVLRIGKIGNPAPARLEIRDMGLAAAIGEAESNLHVSKAAARRGRIRVVGLSIAATLVLLVVAVYGVPALADRLAPIIPWPVERRLGDAVDGQVRAMLDTEGSSKSFTCGGADKERAGRDAFNALMSKLEEGARLPTPLTISVVRRKEANAVTLPGGRIYVFDGLIQKAENPDEVAAVIAHEIGHVAHRDTLRSVLQSAGLSFMFGMLLGDFVGGGAIIIASRVVLQSSYSRNVESAADLYAVQLMERVGGEPRALGRFLIRIAGDSASPFKLSLDHPEAKDRAQAVNAAASTNTSVRLLSNAEWQALKTICAAA